MGSGFLLLLVRTPPPPGPGWGKGHIGVAMDSTQTKHISGCRSNMTETALSSLLLLLPYSPYCHLYTTPVAQQPHPGVPPPAWGLLFCQKTPSRGCLSAHGCPLAGVSPYVSTSSTGTTMRSWGADHIGGADHVQRLQGPLGKSLQECNPPSQFTHFFLP